MVQPLIEFMLRPLAEIQPWGPPDDPRLSWFGLSDGVWWINAGDQRLFEYSPDAVRNFEGPRYCDYQIVRLHEDLLDLMPHALQDIPPELVPSIALGSRESWNADWQRWMAALPDGHLCDADWDLIHSAGSWIDARTLDSGYLSPSFDLRIWSSQGQVHLEWDNRTKLIEDVCAWSAVVGSFVLPADEFLSGVRDFHQRFMDAMAERVEEVRHGALQGRGIGVDLGALEREQHARSRGFQEHLDAGLSRADWDSVVAAMLALEERSR